MSLFPNFFTDAFVTELYFELRVRKKIEKLIKLRKLEK